MTHQSTTTCPPKVTTTEIQTTTTQKETTTIPVTTTVPVTTTIPATTTIAPVTTTVVVPTTVTPTPPNQLPNTGSSVAPLLLTAALLIGSGFAIVRRKVFR